MTTDAEHVLAVLRRVNPAGVADDCSALPELWRWQVAGFSMADVVVALWAEGGGRSLRVLKRLLPGVVIVPRIGGGRPQLTSARADLPKIHLVVHRNPHPVGTSLHRNWFRYRENMPVDVYRRLGGSSRCLEGDVRRGLVRVA